MIKNVLTVIKPNELENYAKEISQHNFFELFNDDHDTIKRKNYSYFLYFGEEEAKAYIQDYLLFYSRTYSSNFFNLQNYLSVFEDFRIFLEREDVYFKYKTIYGSMYVNKNVDIVSYLADNHFISLERTIIETKTKYFYPYFEYLENKVKNSIKKENIVIEKLETEDLMYIQEVFMEKFSIKQPPFYLNPASKTYKFARQMIVNNILPKLPSENAYIACVNNEIVSIIFCSEIKNDKVYIYIMTDMDYMDSSFGNVVNNIKILYKDKCKCIVIKNINRGIASSNLNTACILAHFKPDYDNSENVDGYTQYDYKYIYDNQDEVESFSPMETISFPSHNIN